METLQQTLYDVAKSNVSVTKEAIKTSCEIAC